MAKRKCTLTELGELGGIVLDLLVQILKWVRLDLHVIRRPWTLDWDRYVSGLVRNRGTIASTAAMVAATSSNDAASMVAASASDDAASAAVVAGESDVMRWASVGGLWWFRLSEGVISGLTGEVVQLWPAGRFVGHHHHPGHH